MVKLLPVAYTIYTIQLNHQNCLSIGYIFYIAKFFLMLYVFVHTIHYGMACNNGTQKELVIDRKRRSQGDIDHDTNTSSCDH